MYWPLASAKNQVNDCNVYDVDAETSAYSKIRVGVGERFMIRVPNVDGLEMEMRIGVDSGLVINDCKKVRGGKLRFEIHAPKPTQGVIQFVTIDHGGTVRDHARIWIDAVSWESVPYSQMSDAEKADFDRRYADLDEEVE